MDEIYQHLDSHDKVIGIYLDLQKAFDTIDHHVLLYKMYRIGIRGVVYKWFQDYLYDRKQFVTVKNMNSDICTLTCGVPQGSVLGPLLFLLYVNDIANSVPDTPVKLYADDTNLFIYDKSLQNLVKHAEVCLSKLVRWFTANKLTLSIDKTCYSVFGVTNSVKNNVKLNIDCTEVLQVESTKYLGIIIDSKLTWEEHIDYIYKKSY